MNLAPGLTRTDEFTVDDRLVTDVGGTIGVRTHERRVISVGEVKSD